MVVRGMTARKIKLIWDELRHPSWQLLTRPPPAPPVESGGSSAGGGWVRSPEVLTRPQASAQGSQTFGFPPYAIVGRDDHFDWLSYKFAKASTHSRVEARAVAMRVAAAWEVVAWVVVAEER